MCISVYIIIEHMHVHIIGYDIYMLYIYTFSTFVHGTYLFCSHVCVAHYLVKTVVCTNLHVYIYIYIHIYIYIYMQHVYM